MSHIPYMIFAAIFAFCAGFCAGGCVYRVVSVRRRWRRSRRVPARELVAAMKSGAKAKAERGAECEALRAEMEAQGK